MSWFLKLFGFTKSEVCNCKYCERNKNTHEDILAKVKSRSWNY